MYHANASLESHPEEPSWIRRGHTRKPNWVVRCLYWIFDWLGDFGPMFSYLFHLVGKTATGTWGFLVRAVMLVINLLLVVGIIYLSVGHSYRLLIYAGLKPGVEALVGVSLFEAVFLYCSIVIDLANKNGERNPWAWVAFLIGFVFVEVSNYTGMAHNVVGKSIGITIPFLLLVMKKVLEYQFKKKRQMDDLATENQPQIWNDNQPKMDEQATKKMVEPTIQTTTQNDQPSTKKMVDQPTEKVVEKVVDQPPEKQPEEQPQPTTNETTNHQPIQLDDDQPQTTTFEPVESMESADNQPVEETEESPILESVETTKKMVEETTSEMDEIHQENNHQNNQNIHQVFDQPNNQSTNQISDQTTTKISDENNQPADEETMKSTKKTTKRKKQLTRKRTSSSTEKMKKTAKKWAKEFYSQNGKLPGRLKLQNGVGCSDHVARQTLEELKEELGIAS